MLPKQQKLAKQGTLWQKLQGTHIPPFHNEHCFSMVQIARDEFLSFSDNASKWLMSMDPLVHLKTKKAGMAGARFGRSLQDKSRAPQVLWTNWMDDEDEFCQRR